MSEFFDRISKLSPKRLAFLATELQSQLEATQRAQNEPIAVVGAGCRFPGGAEDLDKFWALLDAGTDAITEVPPDRWNADAFYDPDPDAEGKTYTKRGGFLRSIDQFEPQFFGISPREAISLDPQQRLLLEVSWEALESAGQVPEKLLGSRTGVFIGISSGDYMRLQTMTGAPLDIYAGTGNSPSVAAGRLAYTLGLQGPCVSLDTACSSSLIAVHLACQSLRNGECAVALAGGVNAMLAPDTNIMLSRGRMISADGRCKTFDAAADGYGRGEGCGVVVLKKLSDALAAGDRVLAILRGSAINQDGRSSGLTAPNGPAQEAVVRDALARAGIDPKDVTYVEAHGTGTPLGDPIEVQALAAVLGAGRAASDPVLIGSVKTNIGHLEAAAGVAGLIKVLLALQHERIPPHVGFRVPNPFIPWESLPVKVAAEPVAWKRGGRRRIAGVSSFGFSGSNAHVIVEEAPSPVDVRTPAVERPQHLLTLSARTQPALHAMARRYADLLAEADSPSLADVCFSANTGRSQFERRLAVSGASASEVREALEAFANESPSPRVASGRIDPGARPDVVFLFTGQGSQYPGMARGLYESQPVFRAALEECAAILRAELDVPLLDVLYPADGNTSLIGETAYTQPALFAIEYALAELWRSWGVRPAAALGHSVGEYVAACVAGVFSLGDGLKLIAARGRLMQALPAGGAMAAVGADETTVRSAIEPYASSVSIAAVNAPRQIVVSGERAALAAALSGLEAGGVRVTRIPVSHAFHSPLLEPMLDRFEQVARMVTYAAPKLDVISNVTGNVAAGDDLVTPAYWRTHARSPVQFARSIRTLENAGHRVFLEVGPGPTLTALAQQSAGDLSTWVTSLKADRDSWEHVLGAAAALYVRGVPLDWTGFDRPYRRTRVALPSYAFQRQRYWVEGAMPQAVAAPRAAGQTGSLQAEYEIAWEPAETHQAGAATPAAPAKSWIIFADRGGVGSSLAARLAAAGARTTLVFAGPEDTPAGAHGVDADDREAIRSVVELARRQEAAASPGVAFLWPLDEPPAPDSPEPLHTSGTLHLLRVLQATVASGGATEKFLIATRGAQPAGDEVRPVAVTQAAIWGMARVAALEHADLRIRLVDLDQRGAEADALFEEVSRGDDEDQVAVRDGRRFVARLVRTHSAAPHRLQCAAEGTYLVTGGLGALGLRVAQRLADRGARHLVLMGRRGLPDRSEWTAASEGHPQHEAIAAVLDLERRGVAVRVCRADAADADRIGAILDDVRRSPWPLRGIVHAAGVSTTRALVDLDESGVEEALRPKVNGAWALHHLTRGESLDFFVMFSSIAAVWGSKGLAHYAAANHALDALARHRASAGLAATSVNWGPWAGGGMATADAMTALAGMGVRPVEPDAALETLERLIGSGRPVTTVAAMEWDLFKDVFNARGRRPLLDRIETAGMSASTHTRPADRDRLVQQLREAAVAERQALIAGWVEQEVSAVLGAGGLTLEPDQRFFDLGMDSLMTVELRRRLEARFGCRLDTTVAFDYPTIERLARHLSRALEPELVESAPAASAGPARSLASATAKIAELSDEEVERLFAAKVLQQKA